MLIVWYLCEVKPFSQFANQASIMMMLITDCRKLQKKNRKHMKCGKDCCVFQNTCKKHNYHPQKLGAFFRVTLLPKRPDEDEDLKGFWRTALAKLLLDLDQQDSEISRTDLCSGRGRLFFGFVWAEDEMVELLHMRQPIKERFGSSGWGSIHIRQCSKDTLQCVLLYTLIVCFMAVVGGFSIFLMT